MGNTYVSAEQAITIELRVYLHHYITNFGRESGEGSLDVLLSWFTAAPAKQGVTNGVHHEAAENEQWTYYDDAYEASQLSSRLTEKANNLRNVVLEQVPDKLLSGDEFLDLHSRASEDAFALGRVIRATQEYSLEFYRWEDIWRQHV